MKAARATTPASSNRASSRSPRPAASSPFNSRGVVEKPSFILSRPAVGKKDIELTIHAHWVADGEWIAEPLWICRDGSIPVDGMPLHKGSRRFDTRSEAVDDAMSRALRQVRSQTHRKSSDAGWLDAVESLRAWMADAICEVRAKDESLPLRGVTVIDLFAGGLGGFGMGLASLGATVSLACEIDEQAMRTYKANVRPVSTHADICDLDGSKLKADIVTMGLICQAFSKAGKGLGFADPKLATVYRHALRVVGEIDAKVIVIECARQLLTNGGGKDADELLATLMRAGYRVQHRALNAAGFGVPQSRDRSFVVATRCGLDVDSLAGFLFPEEKAPTTMVADILDDGLRASVCSDDISLRRAEPATRSQEIEQVGRIGGRSSQGYRVYSSKGIGPTLTASGGGRARFSGAYLVAGGARILNPREANRMQGMPEWAAIHGTTLHAMRHAGNAVAVPIARELSRKLATVVGR